MNVNRLACSRGVRKCWTHLKFLNIHYWIPLIVADLKRSNALWAKAVRRKGISHVHEKVSGCASNLESIFSLSAEQLFTTMETVTLKPHVTISTKLKRANVVASKNRSNRNTRHTRPMNYVKKRNCSFARIEQKVANNCIYCWVLDLPKTTWISFGLAFSILLLGQSCQPNSQHKKKTFQPHVFQQSECSMCVI